MEWTTRFAVTLASFLIVVAADPAHAQVAGADAPVWTTQLVDHVVAADDYDATRTFIRALPSGRSIILYAAGPNADSGFDLRVARGPYPDGSFHHESVDPDDQLITGYASLAVDAQGRANVSYVSGVFADQGILKYARRRSTGWTHEVADATQGVLQSAIALDSQARPFIAYSTLGNQLRLATRGSGGWITEPVSGERVVQLDVEVDGADHPRIAYVAFDGSNYVLRMATFDGYSWSFETVGHVSSQGIEFGVDLLIDSEGNAEVVFPVLQPVRGLALAHRTASGWELQQVAAGDLWQPSATLDGFGDVHAVFYDATRGALVYARRSGGTWSLQTVADSPSPSVRVGRLSSIALDGQGRARVSYYVGKEFKGATLRYAVSTPLAALAGTPGPRTAPQRPVISGDAEAGGGTGSRAPGDIVEYPVPTRFSAPAGISPGPDGRVWFTEGFANKIGRITTAGRVKEFKVPTAASYPQAIVSGPDGNLWFTEYLGNRIGRISASGIITEFPLPTASSEPFAIAAGPDGNLWFTEDAGNKIGRITPSGKVKEFAVPTFGSRPLGIAAGDDGSLWFTEYHGNKIGRINALGTVREFPIYSSPGPFGIAAGPDGNLWFTEADQNAVGRITTSGAITEFEGSNFPAYPVGIAAGPDGNLWFTEASFDRIGRITPSGTISEFPIPTSSGMPFAIAAGPDGDMWFTEYIGNQVGRITP